MHSRVPSIKMDQTVANSSPIILPAIGETSSVNALLTALGKILKRQDVKRQNEDRSGFQKSFCFVFFIKPPPFLCAPKKVSPDPAPGSN